MASGYAPCWPSPRPRPGSGRATEDQLLGAVSVELVHLASLYHDDVLDEATIRRNVESVNSRFGNLVAIVAGDYLLARSAAIAASLGTEIAGLLAETLARLCQGQVSEVRSAFQITRSHEDYTTAIAGKTAALDVHVLPYRRPHRRPAAGGGGRAAPSTATASAWCSRSATTSSTSPPRRGSCSSRPGRIWPRASTPCPPWWPWPIPTRDPTCRRSSDARSANPSARRRAPSWPPLRAWPPRSTEAATYVERARVATSGISNHALQEGLAQLASELLSDLPT